MTHTEEIAVYRYAKAADGYGGYTEAAPVLQTDAPTWATVRNTAGGDQDLSLRLVTRSDFEIICNYRSDFGWLRDMFIVSRFGNIDITSITETIRKREVTLNGSLIQGYTSSGAGSGSVGGIYTVYKRSVSGATTIIVSEGNGKTLLMFARDGISKKVVTTTPAVFDEVYWNTSTATLTLFTGDIFGDSELLTFLFY